MDPGRLPGVGRRGAEAAPPMDARGFVPVVGVCVRGVLGPAEDPGDDTLPLVAEAGRVGLYRES